MIKNYENVQSCFNEVILYSQNRLENDINTDAIFEKWATNKEWFYNITNSFIYEYPEEVHFELDDEQKAAGIRSFLDDVYHLIDSDELYDFLADDKTVDLYGNALLRNYKGHTAGTRLSKVLIKEFANEPRIETVRQWLSMLIQNNNVSGTFCLSIHPLDYLSVSENNHKWRSCHALDGEYRAGNVSYMVDTGTIVAYLKSSEDTQLPHFPKSVPWNNKKWRCLLHVDKTNELIYAGKPYPYFSMQGFRIIEKILKEKLYYFITDKEIANEIKYVSNYFGWAANTPFATRKHEYFTIYRDIGQCIFKPAGIKNSCEINGYTWNFENPKLIVGSDYERKIVPTTHYVINHPKSLAFNDVLQSTVYAPWVLSYGQRGGIIPASIDHKLTIGEDFKCLCCNENAPADSDSFFCGNCLENSMVVCEVCGCIGSRHEMINLEYDRWVCERCYDDGEYDD